MAICCLTIIRIQHLVFRLFVLAKLARTKTESLAIVDGQFKAVNLNFRNIIRKLLNYSLC
jgi:hypothetical protein